MTNPDALIEAVSTGAEPTPAPFDIRDDAMLQSLVAAFATPRPIKQAEALEAWVKGSWSATNVEALDAATRVRFTEFFLRIGFVAKYKSYGVKYAAPFGYALFDLEDGGGFSIQLHETAKVEAFHVIGVQSTAFILLCTPDEWAADGAEMVKLWADAQPDKSPLAYRPVAGDVAVIEDLSTVHTVIGCLVEEFATTSYDAVKRLHDQNEGRETKLPDAHTSVADVLTRADLLTPRRYVKRVDGEWTYQNVDSASGDITRLPEMGLVGRHLTLSAENPSASDELDAKTVSTVFVLGGSLQLDVDGTTFDLQAGDVTALAPGSRYTLTSSGNGDTHLSLCEVSTELAFADLR